jgi:hypothetical protein
MAKRFSRKDFLEAIFGEYFRRQDGFVIVKTSRQLDQKLATRHFPNIEILAKEQFPPDQNIYFGVCPRETMKVQRPEIRFCTAFWAGLDLAPDGYSGKEGYFNGPSAAAKAVRSFSLPPSIIVESGLGMHLYWLLNSVTEIRDTGLVEQRLQSINGYFQCKTRVKVDSMLRLPGTFNCKIPGRSVNCEVKYLNTDFRYDLTDFDSLQLAPEIVKGEAAWHPEGPRVAGDTPAPAATSRSQGIAESRIEDFTEDVDRFLAQEHAEKKQLLGTTARKRSPYRGPRSEQTGFPDQTFLKDFEPVPYEAETESVQQEADVLSPESADLMAEKIAKKVLDKLSDKFLKDLVDEIVDKLAKRLMPGGSQ